MRSRDVALSDAEAVEELLQAVKNSAAAPDAVTAIPYRALLGAFVTSILEAECEGDGCESLAQRLACIDRQLVDATLEKLREPHTGLKRKVRAILRARPTALEIALFILRKPA